MDLLAPFHRHKEQPAIPEPAEREPVTDEGISEEAVNKSEAFVDPLKTEAAAKDVGEVAINAEKAGDTVNVTAESKPSDNVVELPTPETPAPEDPQPPVGSDHQISA